MVISFNVFILLCNVILLVVTHHYNLPGNIRNTREEEGEEGKVEENKEKKNTEKKKEMRNKKKKKEK